MYAIALLCLMLIGCAVLIYRLSREIDVLMGSVNIMETDLHYLRNRNRAMTAELLTYSRTALYDSRDNAFSPATKTVSTASLPPEHPQKRKTKSIRGKKK